MGNRNNFWKGLLACAALMAMATASFAVTKADVIRLKNKVANGEQLTKAETQLAVEAEAAFGSKILEPQGLESPRRPNGRLDEYEWNEVTHEWIDITGTGTPAGITGDDQNVGPFNLGFTVTYYDVDYTSVRMCSNGWASFTSTSTIYTNTELPNAAEPNTVMYAFWDDLYPPTGGEFYYYSDTANDRFILSWINVPSISNDAVVHSFQIVINEGGSIQYNYQLVTATPAPGNSNCTVGIEDATGATALQV